MVEMADVATKLAERTAQGRVPWKTAVGESSFSAKLGNLMVLISNSSGSIKLSVINEKGIEIDVLQPHGLTERGQRLAALFRSAKRTALGTDRTLEELLELLDDTPPAGLDNSIPNQGGRRH